MGSSYRTVQSDESRRTRSPRAGASEVRVHRTTDEFRELAPAWDALVESSPRPWLYLTHGWMSAWWDFREGNGRKLYLMVARDGETPVAIAPFVRTGHGIPPLRFRRLSFMTMERYAYSSKNLSGSLEFIAPKDSEGSIADILAQLSANNKDWDYLRFHPLPAGSETLTNLLTWADTHGYPYTMRHVISNAIIDIPPTWEEYLRNLPQSNQKSLRRVENAIAKRGGMRVIEPRPDDDFNQIFADMADIDRRSWKDKRGVPLGSEEYGEFYRNEIELAARQGNLLVWFLEADGKKIAYDLFIRHGSTAENLKGSYDISFAKFSPGRFLVPHELRGLQSRGITRMNLLWGDLPYKMKWTDKVEMGYELYISNRTPRGMLVHWGYLRSGLCRGVRFLRHLPERLSRR